MRLIKSISVKVAIALILSSTIIMVVLGVYTYTMNRNSSIDEINNLSEQIINRLSNNLAEPLLSFNDGQIDTMVDQEMVNKNVFAIIVYDGEYVYTGKYKDESGKIKDYTETGNSVLESELDQSFIIKGKDIKKMNASPDMKAMGFVEVFIMEDYLNKELFGFIYSMIIQTVAVSLMILVVGYIYIRRAIISPIRRIEDALTDLSEGNLSVECVVKSKDELGNLANSVNTLTDKFKDIITSVVESVKHFTGATTDIARGNQDLAQRTTEQAESLDELTTTIIEMGVSIDTNMDNAEKAQELSNNIKTGIESLNDSSKKMHDIIQVIESISFETNLLALNASIEAARAGQAGKGFEVVATEVKELSDRSSTQAKEIYGIIEESIKKVETNVQLVDKIVDLIQEISLSSKNQHESSQQINNSISQLNEVTQQNSSLVDQSASASEEIASQAQELQVKVLSYFNLKNNNKNKKPLGIPPAD